MIVEPRYMIPIEDTTIARHHGLGRSRRWLVLGAVAALVGAPMVRAQPQRKPARIGLLSYYSRSEAEALQGMQPFLTGMRERGHVLGEHFVLDIRVSGGMRGVFRHSPMN